MVEPLALALHAHTPVRAPRDGRTTVVYGYHLRLESGLLLTTDDPLLAAFGASIEALETEGGQSESLQADGFDPGRQVRLVREGVDDDGDEVVGVWDQDEVRRAGSLPYRVAARVGAAIDHGLNIHGLVLGEMRQRSDDRRSSLAILVYPPALIAIDVAAGGPLQRPSSRARPRLVLIADEAAGLRWWDPSGTSGPLDLDAVPVSATLSEELQDLASAYVNAPDEPDQLESADFYDHMEGSWHRHVLAARTRSVWDRVRRELGRSYALGLMLRGMSQPAWSPEEFDANDDDDIPF